MCYWYSWTVEPTQTAWSLYTRCKVSRSGGSPKKSLWLPSNIQTGEINLRGKSGGEIFSNTRREVSRRTTSGSAWSWASLGILTTSPWWPSGQAPDLHTNTCYCINTTSASIIAILTISTCYRNYSSHASMNSDNTSSVYFADRLKPL